MQLRRLLYSLVPVALLVGGLEAGLRLAGWRASDEDLRATAGMFEGAWVQRRDQHLGPAFVEDAAAGMVQTSTLWAARGMHQQRFPAASAGELRLVALGGSTTVGLPFEHQERGFPERLERRLRAAAPERRWRAINAGVPGMDSRGFPALAREAVARGAHGLVIYAGNNELRGTLIDECTNPLRTRLARQLDRLALLRAGRALYRRLQPPPPTDLAGLQGDQRACMRSAIDAARAGLAGPPQPRRTDPLYATTVQTFRRQLDAVVAVTRRAGIPVWIAIPPIHLRHPPTLGLPHPALDEAQQRALAHALAQAGTMQSKGEPLLALEELQRAVALDPSHALVQHRLGMVLLALDRPEEARPHLEAAVDLDWEGDRVTRELQGVVRALCDAHPVAVRCVDLDAAFRAAAPQGLPGDELFVDFCHPTFERGVDLIADGYAAPILAWSRGEG